LGVHTRSRRKTELSSHQVVHFGSYDAPGSDPYDAEPAEVGTLIHGAHHRFHILAPVLRSVVSRI
jgi:hypothetical protein